MCGIAGLVSYTRERPDPGIVRGMIDVMRHRGPDGHGVLDDRNVCLGHVRLSIIDVAGSKQPLANEDETVWVTFNGEIYNYPDLRADLLSRGHRFRTQGDTETLVHLYEEHGVGMLSRLQGMFAFAIWDKKRRQLFMARDRMGIKPLYYCRQGDDFLFASEIKAFFQHPDVAPRPSQEGIWHYLTYNSAPAPGTLFEGIAKVKPGHYMTVGRQGVETRCYWDIPLQSASAIHSAPGQSADELQDRVETLLTRAVERRLISDVPVGAFLSGGIDSSLIVALMSRLTNAPVRTYSVGFQGFPSSELPHAQVVASEYATDHHELILEEDCFADHLEKLTWIRDSPLSQPGDVPLYLLSKMAQRDVKVLLSGEGSDELFAGYPKHAYDRFASALGLLPGSSMRSAADMLPGRLRRVAVAIRSLCEREPAGRWAQWFAPFTPQERTRLTATDGWANPTRQYAQAASACSPLDAMLYADCKLWLPDNLLDRGDRMTMGASVEGRVPFLDHELVEYAFTLPGNMKLRGFTRKYAVKQIALKYLPEAIVNRRKVGFSLPLRDWFRGRLRDMCYDRICATSGFLSECLDAAEVRRVLDDHCSGRKDNWLQIWTLLGLAIWGELFCRRPISSTRERFGDRTISGWPT